MFFSWTGMRQKGLLIPTFLFCMVLILTLSTLYCIESFTPVFPNERISLAPFNISEYNRSLYENKTVLYTVEEQTQRIVELADSYKRGSARQKREAISQLVVTAQDRKDKLLTIAAADPNTAIKAARLDAVRKDLPLEVQPSIETMTLIEGELIDFHGDDFVNRKVAYFHQLITSDNQVRWIHFTDKSREYDGRTRVRLKGKILDNHLIANAVDLIQLNVTPLPLSPPSTGIIAQYSFEGNTLDASTNANTLSTKGNLVFVNTTLSNRAALFDGINACANISLLRGTSLDALTVSMWIKKNGLGYDGALFYLYGHAATFFTDGDSLHFQTQSDDFWPINNWNRGGIFLTSLDDTKWHHIAISYNGSIAQGYVDGQMVGSEGPFRMQGDDGDYSLYLGCDRGFEYQTYNGTLDEVTLYNKALSSNEIATLYQTQKTVVIPAPVQEPAKTIKKVAVIFFNFQSPLPFDPSYDLVRQAIFTGPSSVNAFYNETSFGQWGLEGYYRKDGDVFGPYTVAYPVTSCDTLWQNWIGSAQFQAVAGGLNISLYDRFVFISPNPGTCSFSGVTYSGNNRVYVLGSPSSSYLPSVIAHELGHSFGLGHANWYTCVNATGATVPISTTCTSIEYGDPYDVMAVNYYHFNNYHKSTLGFFKPQNIQVVKSNGTYTLEPTEWKTNGVQSIRIKRLQNGLSTRYYYLEYRRPYGFDFFSPNADVSNGVSIRISGELGAYATHLINPIYRTGMNFTDPFQNITIRVLNTTSKQTTLSVEFGQRNCNSLPPVFSIGNINTTAAVFAGVEQFWSGSIRTQDSGFCDSIPYNISISPVREGWSYKFYNRNLIELEPGYLTSAYVNFGINASRNTLPGKYYFNITATNLDKPYANTTTQIYLTIKTA